nr:PREDICTED: 5-hydroxytryptamine receptor 3E-like [Paralichthys olivaceus]
MTSKDKTLKCIFPFVTPTLVVFVILMPAPCSAIKVNCSQPNQLALLEALTPIFSLSAIRPVTNMTTRTNINTSFILYGILGVDEKAQLLTTYLWLHYCWMNELVSWDPVECGTHKIILPRNKFWMPDIVINEFMDENTAPHVPYVNLYSNGRVRDAYPAKVVSSCNLDIYNFPFDIQNCSLTFNSYIHNGKDINIFLSKSVDHITEHSKQVMTTMGEWELLDITSNNRNLDLDDGNYIDELIFHIRLKRRATLYVVNLLIPSCFLITVDLFSFLLPPQTVDRSSFKMTLILGYTVFLLIMNDLLPITGNSIPLINVFFSLCLALMVASLLETILITNLLCGSANFSPVPRWIQVLVLQIPGCLVPLSQKAKDSAECSSSMMNCSQPDTLSLLEAFKPVFKLSAIRPVMDISTITNVNISFTLFDVFLCLCLALMVASLLETILITNLLCGSTHYSAVPHWIRVLVLHILGRLVRLPPKSRDLQDVTVMQNPAAHEMKVSSVVEEDIDAPEQKGPLNEDKALDELRSLGKELQGLRLRVEQHLVGNQSSEEWIQVGCIIERLLCGLYILFISFSFITITIIWVRSYNT